MMRKSTIIAALTGISFFASVSAVLAEEASFVETDKGIQYYIEDGNYIVNSWIQDADLNWYHFDENGYMQTGWYQDENGTYYWLDENGRMVHDTTCTIQDVNYIFSSNGALHGRWQTDSNGRWYQKEEDGSYLANTWELLDGSWYRFDENGYMQTGWYQDENGTYYWLDENGRMVHDTTCTIQDVNYIFSSNGALHGRWQTDSNGRWYQKEEDGSYLANTWELLDGSWYHFDENGYMQTGWYTEGEETDAPKYFLKDSGERASNEVLQLDEENLYTFDENGVLVSTEPIKTEAERELEQLASQIVTQLVTENMTKREKATVIYKWIQSHISYIATSNKSDWVTEAIQGLKTRRGDCFTYYSVSRAMLDAAGIENIPVYPKEGYHVHYWNIINVEGGWYHFDTTPRKSGATFCIVTNAQYDALSSNRYSTGYLENGMEYPEMAEK